MIGALVSLATSVVLALPAPTFADEAALTFNKDIAPIIFESCATCHRPNGGAPFNLLTYSDVATRAGQIKVVTQSRYMPPWHPKAGRGEFAGNRALSADAIERIARWHAQGKVEGDPADLPPTPTWTKGWELGPPDLVLQLPEPYGLAADGPDVYRNFVLSVPLEQPVQVRTVDFDSGNPRVVHHAFILLDRTDKSRRLAAETPGQGFGNADSMNLPDTVAGPGDSGFFHGWNPGRRVFPGYDDMSWPLDASYDIVLQLHLQPSGKVEQVQPSIALYFAQQPPTRFPIVIGSRSAFIDIPPGERDFSFEISYTLPVDVDVLAVSPHAHYIAKDMQGFAILPSGETRWLIHIEDWDFNWQEDYRYKEPVFLPKGSRLTQRFTYDNSHLNPRNPANPPRRVRAGDGTFDEMGELWYQVLTRKPEDRAVLREDWVRFMQRIQTPTFEQELAENREKRKALEALLTRAQADLPRERLDDAIEHAARAIRKWPDDPEPRYAVGRLMLQRANKGDLKRACRRLARAIRMRPDFTAAHLALGRAWHKLGDLDKAQQAFELAHELEPSEAEPLYRLGLVAEARGDSVAALELFERALTIEPSHEPIRAALNRLRGK